MNNKVIIGVVAVVLAIVAGGYYFTRTTEKVVTNNTAEYSNSKLGYEFDYKTGPEGYVVQEGIPASNADGLLSNIMLIQAKDVPTFENPPVGGEYPAAIHISVYANTKKQQPLNWANDHVQLSNINLKQGNAEETVVGGANAIHYKADGLYPSDIYVVASNSNIYVLQGQYLDESSALHKDFAPIVQSFRFIPMTGSTGTTSGAVNAKINIDAVCQGALSYMTFPDGKSADLFVKECKEGKHPEVIEKYKADMNLGDGAAI